MCIQNGHLPDGRRILALTFTNKARDNLISRVTDHAGVSFRRWITVVNFHGLALHLYNRHRYVLGDPVRELLPDDRALRSIERRVFDEFNVPRPVQQEIRVIIRNAKAGPFTDGEVIGRLEEIDSGPALEYERLLQSESRMDHDDVLRFGLQIIQTEGVAHLYSERYAYVLVDEAQDLTRVQYDLVEPIGRGCTVFAGDKAQGIYGFAGADPDWVFDRIGDRSPISVHLDKSYRSTPEVLAVVNAVAGALGGPALMAANPGSWAGRGRACLAVFDAPADEAEWLLNQISHWQNEAAAEDPPRRITIGVLTRMKVGGRRETLLEQACAAGLAVETWDHPLHRPEVVQLLRRHLDGVLATVADPRQQIEELYLRCFADVPAENANTLIDLRDAADELVEKWLDIIRGSYAPTQVDNLKLGSQRPPFPYSDVRLLPYLQHSFWFLPKVASCHAMANLLAEKQNTFWHDYGVLTVAGTSAGVGLDALPPVRKAIGSGFDTKTITLSCGKLTTGVTIPQWSSILMLRNLKSPETYFQAAFRVQSPWSITNPNGDDPNEDEVLKPACFVFDFAPTRALRQLADYGIGLSPSEPNPEKAVEELVSFLPVLAYDGSHMTQIDAGGILDIAMAGTSATLLARKWESALLVNVDNLTLRRILDNPEAMAAVERIEGWRSLGDNVIETIINKSEKVKELKNKAKDGDLTSKEKKELTEEEKEYKSKRKLVQEKLIKFATRIPAFMYLTDFRENTLQDVITKLEPDLFLTVTGLTVEDFHLLVRLKVFNTEQMNQAVFAFRRYEDSSLAYTGIDSHPGLTHYGLYDTVVAREA